MPSNLFDVPENNAQRAELWEQFDTTRLRRAADALYEILSALGCNMALGPNELRDDLDRLHMLVLNQQTRATYPNINSDVFELADSIESTMFDVKEAAETILETVRDLVDLFPDPDDDYEEE